MAMVRFDPFRDLAVLQDSVHGADRRTRSRQHRRRGVQARDAGCAVSLREHKAGRMRELEPPVDAKFVPRMRNNQRRP